MVSRWIFLGFAILVGAQRLLELRVSRGHERQIRAAGGIEYAAGQYPWMALLHGSWLAAMVGEVFVFRRVFSPVIAVPAAVVFLAGQALRYAAILTLGWRWNVRVLVLPGRERITQGIYRYIRHPNYLGVALEIFSAPLIHSAFITAFLFSIANGIFLKARIHAEEAALVKNELMRVVN